MRKRPTPPCRQPSPATTRGPASSSSTATGPAAFSPRPACPGVRDDTHGLAGAAALPRRSPGVAERLRDDLAGVGVTVRLREVATWTEHVDLTSRGEFDLALLGWQADTLDPNDFLSALLESGSIGTTNRSRYRSAAMDGLLKRARMDSAPGTRLARYREVQELFQREMPFVPLYHSPVFTAHRRRSAGW